MEQCRREIQRCESIIKAQKENEEKLVVIKKLQKLNKKDSQEESFVQMMDDQFEEFEKKT